MNRLRELLHDRSCFLGEDMPVLGQEQNMNNGINLERPIIPRRLFPIEDNEEELHSFVENMLHDIAKVKSMNWNFNFLSEECIPEGNWLWKEALNKITCNNNEGSVVVENSSEKTQREA